MKCLSISWYEKDVDLKLQAQFNLFKRSFNQLHNKISSPKHHRRFLSPKFQTRFPHPRKVVKHFLSPTHLKVTHIYFKMLQCPLEKPHRIVNVAYCSAYVTEGWSYLIGIATRSCATIRMLCSTLSIRFSHLLKAVITIQWGN